MQVDVFGRKKILDGNHTNHNTLRRWHVLDFELAFSALQRRTKFEVLVTKYSVDHPESENSVLGFPFNDHEILFSEGVLYMNTFVVNLQVGVNMVGSRFHCRYCFVS